MSNSSITYIAGATAETGSRGEFEHVRTDNWSVHVWHLRDLARGALHSNNYDLTVYVQDGALSIYDAAGNETVVKPGDSALVPAGTDYAMSAAHADLVECRGA